MGNPKPFRVVVWGAGSWGTALAVLLARNGADVTLCGRTCGDVSALGSDHENRRYLPGCEIPANVTFGLIGDRHEPFDLAVMAVPSDGVAETAQQTVGLAPVVVIASKGLDPATGDVLSALVERADPCATVAGLSGPNLAVEIVRGVPTVAVAACPDAAVADAVARAFNSPWFRVYTSDDLVGVELAGALKNVLAIGAGLSDGLGYGDNTKAALVARGLNEMTRLGAASGARPETFFGIAGVGDLFATANSRLSRNYRVGHALGEGKTLAQALAEIGQVAEGVGTARAARHLAELRGVELPIHRAIAEVIDGTFDPRHAVSLLMDRLPRRETWPGVTIEASESPLTTSAPQNHA